MKNVIQKGMDKYRHFGAPVKASVWFTICSIIQKSITLITTPIFTRLLTTSQYGMFTLYQSWFAIVSIFATLNLSAGVYFNGMTNFPEDRDRMTAAFQGLSITATGILFAIYLVDIPFWNQVFGMNTILMLTMFLQAFFTPAYAFWAVQQRYNYKYVAVVTLTLLMAILSPALGVVSVMLSAHKAEARVLSFVLIQVAEGAFFLVLIQVRGKVFFVKKYWKYALAFNLPLIPHYLSMMVLNQADRILIGKLVGTSQAAIYAVAYQISMMMNVVTSAINSSFVPYTYKQMKAKKYDDIGKNSNFILLLVAVLCLLAMAFAPELVKIFAAPQYMDAIWIMPPTAASVFFIFLYSLYANVEFFFEKTKFIMIASIGGAAVNIGLNYLLIPHFGYYVAGYTTLICYIIFSISHYVFHKIVLKEKRVTSAVYNDKFTLVVSILLILAMFLMLFLYNHIFVRYTAIGLLLVGMLVKRSAIIKMFAKLRQK